jgi:hypothetical protein
MRVSYFILFVSLFAQNAFACSCPEVGKIDSTTFSFYNSIVLGEIIDVSSGNDSLEVITVLMKESYHGNNADTITILSPISVGACGIKPKVGQKWLLFSILSEDGLYTNRCSRSGNIDYSTYNRNSNRKYKQIMEDLNYLVKQ